MNGNQQAADLLISHHAEMVSSLRERAQALVAAAERGVALTADKRAFLAYVHEILVPHALAEEKTLYPAAAQRPQLSALVHSMITEHRRILSLFETIQHSDDSVFVAAYATALFVLFEVHATKENEEILPPLRDDPTCNLAQLVEAMHRAIPQHTAVETQAESQITKEEIG
ncbi:MAG: hemerythrin domain-containing protein [Firmicutes bacterium]|nr:hemerythrin domain-containing protein [Bacillota bacterium]